jgi:hypothetical protein
MYLTFRNAKASDLEGSFGLVKDRHGYEPALQKNILKFWRALLDAGDSPLMVVEDRDQPRGQRLVAFGSAFFATDEFAAETKTNLPPFLDRRAMEWWLGGKRPFLKGKRPSPNPMSWRSRATV